jgi:DNA polymerase I-like protein with 3'-5' exonuclease and polymerase domains
VDIGIKDNNYNCKVWNESIGNIGDCSFDSETTLIENQITPDFVIGSVFAGDTVYFIKKESLTQFFHCHQDSMVFMANAPFDLLVLNKACNLCPYKLIESQKLVDIQLLAQLVAIAETGDILPRVNLAYLTKTYLRIDLPKDEKDEDGKTVRTSFDQFISLDGSIEYARIPNKYLEYSGLDAIVTYKLAMNFIEKSKSLSNQYGVNTFYLLSHQIQLMAHFALTLVSKNGLTVDTGQQVRIYKELKTNEEKLLGNLQNYGWAPGDGSSGNLQIILSKLMTEHGFTLPKTKTGKISSSSDSLMEHYEIPFIRAYLDYIKNKKLQDFANITTGKVHPRFNPIVSTGRTSCSSPNVQNLPRDTRVRSMFRATPGFVILAVDYSQIELRALAQITLNLFGKSKMRDLLNSGCDLHSYFASILTGKPEEQISNEERRRAKACNFGFPGGLGIGSFIEYAKVNYNVIMTLDQAHTYHQIWLETFPEVKDYLECDDELTSLSDSGDLLKTNSPLVQFVMIEKLVWIFKGIISGRTHTSSTNREYSMEEIEWAFGVLEKIDFPSKHKFINSIVNKKGSYHLWKHFLRRYNSVIFESGRIRAFTDYCQSKNNPFQGLAADGAKVALYSLIKSGFKVINFIHDEYLIEIPLDSKLAVAEETVRNILITSMAVYCPNVKVEVDAQWMYNWSKKGTHKISPNGVLKLTDEME